MKLSKFITLVSFLTCFSLLYVYQQTEIIRLAYAGQKNQAEFSDLLEKNKILRYNIEKSASLVHIGERITECADYEMPSSYQLVRLTPSEGPSKLKTLSANSRTFFARFFSIKREAEAKTINP